MDRREFLKVAGTGGAGAVLGGLLGSAITTLADEPRHRKPSGVLAFYNWSFYIFGPLLQEFVRQTGIERVQYDTFENEDQVRAAIMGGDSGYDLAILLDANIPDAVAAGAIQPLDKGLIPSHKLLTPKFANPPYDPDLKYSIAYVWGTTGIGYNTRLSPAPVTGWAKLFDTSSYLPAAQGRVAMLDDMRETIGAALKARGYSLNSSSSAEIAAARDLLLAQKPYLASVQLPDGSFSKYVGAPDYITNLGNGNWVASHAWNGDIVMVGDEINADVTYVAPQEGGALWVDNFVIPRGAKNAFAAHAMIDFLLDPAHETLNTLEIGYANPSALSYQWLPASIRDNPAIYPSDAIQEKLEIFRPLDQATLDLYSQVWAEVKAA